MARDSCISHPPNQDFFIVRRGYYEMTGGNKIQAALLWAFEWFTTHRIREMRHNNEPGEPWIEVSLYELEQEMFGFFSNRRIPEAINALETDGWLLVDRSGPLGKTTRYLFLVEKAQLKLNQWSVWQSASNPKNAAIPVGQLSYDTESPVGQLSDGSTDNCPSHVGQLSDAIITKEVIEEEIEETPIVPFTDPSDQKTENTEPDAPDRVIYESDLSVEDPPEVFLQNTYSRTKCGKFRKTGKHAGGLGGFMALEDIYGAKHVRAVFLTYLTKTEQWFRDNHWPLQYFVKNYGRLDMDHSQLNLFVKAKPAEPVAAVTSDSRPWQPAPEMVVRFGLDQLAKKWNELVPSQPVIWDGSMHPKYHPSVETPKFAGMFAELCEKAELLISTKPGEFAWYLNFHWFIGEKEGIANWTKLAGKHFGTRGNTATIKVSMAEQAKQALRGGKVSGTV